MLDRLLNWLHLPTNTSAFGYRLVVAAGALVGSEAWWWTRLDFAAQTSLAALGGSISAMGVTALLTWALPMVSALPRRWFLLLAGLTGAQIAGLWLAARLAMVDPVLSAHSLGQGAVLTAFGTFLLLAAVKLFEGVDAHRASLAETAALIDRARLERAQALDRGAGFDQARGLATAEEFWTRLRELLLRVSAAASVSPSAAAEAFDSELADLRQELATPPIPAPPALPSARIPWREWGLAPRLTVAGASRGWVLVVSMILVPGLALPVADWGSAWAGCLATGVLLSGLWWLVSALLRRTDLPSWQAVAIAACGQALLGVLGLQWLAQAHPASTGALMLTSATVPAVLAVLCALFQALAARAMSVADALNAAELELSESLTLVRQRDWLRMRSLRLVLAEQLASAMAASTTGPALAGIERMLQGVRSSLASAAADAVSAIDFDDLREPWIGVCELRLEIEAGAREVMRADWAAARCVHALLQDAISVAVQEGFARRVVVNVRQRAGLLLLDVVDDGVGLLAHASRERSYSLFDELCLEWAIENTSRGTVLQATLPTAGSAQLAA